MHLLPSSPHAIQAGKPLLRDISEDLNLVLLVMLPKPIAILPVKGISRLAKLIVLDVGEIYPDIEKEFVKIYG